MRAMGKIVGYILWIGAGILMFLFWFTAMRNWLGFLGVGLAFLLAPGAVIFPAIFWIVEGVFPSFYFIVWGIGIVGIVIAGLSSSGD